MTTTAHLPDHFMTDDTPRKRLLWLDFETNGLHDMGYEVHVLEVAAVVTDADLNELAVFEPTVLRVPDNAYASMSDFVLQMHTDNGLLHESKRSEILAPTVDQDLSTFVAEWFPSESQKHESGDYDYKGAVVAGSSVGSFDLRVLSERFPVTRKLCSHRTYDVSAVNEFCARLGFPSVNSRAIATESEHRALSDIYRSIGFAKTLREMLGH